MKRKVVNPDIQQKKRQQAIKKEQNKDLIHEIEEKAFFSSQKKYPKNGS